MIKSLEDRYLQKMLYFDAGRNLSSFTVSCYKDLFRYDLIENLSDKIISNKRHSRIKIIDTNIVCASRLVEKLAETCSMTGNVFIYCDDFSFKEIYNAIYIPCCDIFMYCGENIAGCDVLNLLGYYYLTDRRNEKDIYYKKLSEYFFNKRYELT